MSSHDPFAPSSAVAPPSGADAVPTPTYVDEVPVSEDGGVKQGTIGEVMDWVGDDAERAQAALDAENASGDPRKTLVHRLQEKLG